MVIRSKIWFLGRGAVVFLVCSYHEPVVKKSSQVCMHHILGGDVTSMVVFTPPYLPSQKGYGLLPAAGQINWQTRWIIVFALVWAEGLRGVVGG